jgi:hypothetical protein
MIITAKEWFREQLSPYLTAIKKAIAGPSSWGDYVLRRDTSPTLAGVATAPVAGRVLSYTLNGLTRYRLVPEVYSYNEDAFYSEFSGGVCSGLIVRRSQ